MNYEIATLPAQRYACLAHKGAYHLIGESFGKIAAWGAQRSIPIEGAAGFYYDDPGSTPEAELRSHAGIPVPPDFTPGQPEIEIVDLPAGRYFKATHMGSYEGLGQTWGAFMAAIEESDTPADYKWTFEIYVNDCDKVPADQVQTDLYCAIAE